MSFSLSLVLYCLFFSFFFFFNDTATTEIYTLSLHDALPISRGPAPGSFRQSGSAEELRAQYASWLRSVDRKSTRLNSSHLVISYAVFCLKKKKKKKRKSVVSTDEVIRHSVCKEHR